MKHLLKVFGLDAIYGLDWETYWDSKYRMGRTHMATTEYVTDPRFKTQCVSVQRHDERKATVLDPKQFERWKKTIKWGRVGFLAHHAQFDGLIASHYFGIHPKMMFCTMSMGRPLMPIEVGGSLDAMCKAFKLRGKVGAEALVDTMGKRDLTPAEYKALAKYAGNDIEECWLLFKKLLPYLPQQELGVIDTTVRMFTAPTVRINEAEMRAVTQSEVDHKAALLKAVKLPKSELSSNAKFLVHLQALGVDPPLKIKPSVKKTMEEGDELNIDDFIPALAASDLEFKNLLAHENKKVRQLVEARLAIKSVNMEKKSERLADRAKLGAVPIYLNYAGARTQRWSGGDKVNMQALDRDSGMRKAIHAPRGFTFIIADLAQIEARKNAWFSGQDNIVEAFRLGQKVYEQTAAEVYRKPIGEITRDERFVGKTAVLGCGFQAGGKRFGAMVRIGQFGPPVEISDEDAVEFVRGWRLANFKIVNGWKETNELVKSAFLGGQKLEHKFGIVYEGVGNTGFIHHTPTGMSMRYDGVDVDEKTGNLTYIAEYRKGYMGRPPAIERKKLYGGLLVENRTQFMARQVIVEHLLEVAKLPQLRIALSTHDELLCVVPTKLAAGHLKSVKRIMSTAPAWAPGLPLAVDAHISVRYDK